MFRRSDATLDRTPLPTGRPQPCPVEGRLTWGGADFIGDWNWSGGPRHRSGKLAKAWVLAPASQKKRSISFGYHKLKHRTSAARGLRGQNEHGTQGRQTRLSLGSSTTTSVRFSAAGLSLGRLRGGSLTPATATIPVTQVRDRARCDCLIVGYGNLSSRNLECFEWTHRRRP